MKSDERFYVSFVTNWVLMQVSNTFYFTFTVRPEAKANGKGFRLRSVVPATEEEARRIIERMDAEKDAKGLEQGI